MARQLPERPQDVHLETEESAAKALAEQLSGSGGEGVSTTGTDADSAPLPPISFTAAMRIPNVLSYALAFGFLKVLNRGTSRTGIRCISLMHLLLPLTVDQLCAILLVALFPEPTLFAKPKQSNLYFI